MSEAAVGDLRPIVRMSEGQQLALLPEDGAAAEAAIERRGAGRPPGAQNRATRAMRDYILSRFTDPATALASHGLRSTMAETVQAARALAQVMGIKNAEALEFMRKCSEAILPYTHSKQPLAVQLTGKVAQLHIAMTAPGDRVGGDALAALLDGFGGEVDDEDLAELENLEKSEA